MSNCLEPAVFDGLLAGTLPHDTRQSVDLHLSGCTDCRRRYETLRDRKQLAASSGPIDGYEILAEVHRGGQGSIYKAVQKSTQRLVALKVLRGGTKASRREQHRFEREIRLSAGLKHPCIVTVYDSGVSRDQYYFAMEYVHGQRLDDYLSAHSLSLDQVLRLFAKICDAVNCAHQRGVIHRDLKPGNILIDAQGEPRILDFGLARTAEGRMVDGSQPATVTSEFMGTLTYASPEQLKGDPTIVDLRTDVYSLGVILYQLLTDEFPHRVSWDLTELLRSITECQPTPPSVMRPELGGDLDTIVLKALAKEKDRRYQTAGEMGTDLERYLSGDAIAARRASPWYVAGKRALASGRRHPVLATLAILIAAVVLVEWFAAPVIFDKTRLNRVFERLLHSRVLAVAPTSELQHVAIIGLSDDTDIERLANAEVLSGVSADQPRSLRRLHGRLMERLASSGARVVAWDIAFRGETEYDHDFVAGVQSLKRAGTPVIVGVPTWWSANGADRSLSRHIAPEVRWGCTTASFSARAQWALELAMQHGLAEPIPALALAAVACARQPASEFSIVMDQGAGLLNLVYWQHDPQQPGARNWRHGADGLHVSAIRELPKHRPDFGLARGDQLAYFAFPMPVDECLQASTVEYDEVFRLEQKQLQERLANKIVIIGDFRNGTDRHEHPDGRTLAGCQGHAVAVNALLQQFQQSDRRRPLAGYWWTALGALGGLAIVLAVPERLRWRVTSYTAMTLVFAIGSIWLFKNYRYLCNPLMPALATLVTCELLVYAGKLRTRRA